VIDSLPWSHWSSSSMTIVELGAESWFATATRLGSSFEVVMWLVRCGAPTSLTSATQPKVELCGFHPH